MSTDKRARVRKDKLTIEGTYKNVKFIFNLVLDGESNDSSPEQLAALVEKHTLRHIKKIEFQFEKGIIKKHHCNCTHCRGIHE